MGDKCKKGGNDFLIFEAVKSLKQGRSYEVTNPNQTIKLIELSRLNYT